VIDKIEKYLTEDSFDSFKNSIYLQLTKNITSIHASKTPEEMERKLKVFKSDIDTIMRFHKKRIK
jgi:hypothetical protein